jgi:uncharacterized protein YuzE
MENLLHMYYDRGGAILYLSVGEPRPAISEELEDDILVRLDAQTGEIVGLTVFNFSSRFESPDSRQSFPVTINLQKLG